MTYVTDYRRSFLRSARTRENRFQSLDDTRQWLHGLQEKPNCTVARIPLADIEQWYFDEDSGDLRHTSGRFFSIAGLHCSPANNPSGAWEQPIIFQPEIGILGILTREFDGTRYFLMQAKMEPGNVNLVQLSPTVQATFSNYSQAHKGKLPPYTHYFLDPDARLISSQLQSETGTRFYRKFNRNVLIDLDHDPELLPGFRWLTLHELQALMMEDDMVNMDTRSVLSNIAYAQDGDVRDASDGAAMFRRSATSGPETALRSLTELRHWLRAARARHVIDTRPVALNAVSHWIRDDWGMRHQSGNYFEIAGVRVDGADREVPHWCQPLLRHEGVGLAGFLCASINDVLHFLIQAKPEPGIVGNVEIAPTVSLFDYRTRAAASRNLPFLEYFLEPHEDDVLHSSIQSEEGGRFWNLRNHFLVVKVPDADAIDGGDDFEWVTLAQLQQLGHGESLVNSEARSLLAILRLYD